ncbi:hypothetical protein B0T18DRAFT_385118 [Schizothecium vesticola]|uniref:Protein-S-isoprenylcysteine O-methyltransferase n=1 Tax=Schizothecium vesticola TaxID=314040 RepID=A0AA40F845_9PEZI|nr:hypothetical protein B0T18DRAFT_385118 [Schizothecium vesticola]
MPFPPSLSQATFATAVLASAAGCIIGLTPPNPSPPSTAAGTPPAPTTLSRLRHFITNGNLNNVILAPIAVLSLHTVGLALTHPLTPSWIPTTARLNPRRISWSTDTAVPLALLLCVGIPLRLIAFRTLGDSFTFKLATPKRGLVTTGVYRYLQHPSYTGAAVIFVAPMVLLYRDDGAMGCWMPEGVGRVVERVVAPLVAAGMLTLMGMRVVEEERMLRGRFGEEWERWTEGTARFVPWLW